MGYIAWIVAGLIAGWLTGKIMKGSGYGFFADILLGLVGAFVGGFISNALHLGSHGGFIHSTVLATIGAVVVVATGLVINQFAASRPELPHVETVK